MAGVSRLDETLKRLSDRAASAVVARGRIASPALNAALLRRLSASPGAADAFLADPVFEATSTSESTDRCLGGLSGELLQPELVDALDNAGAARMARDLRPWSHQLEAWTAAREGLSCLVSSGTGSGKTECFMLPDAGRAAARSRGGSPDRRARHRGLSPERADREPAGASRSLDGAAKRGRLRFALYNGLTPETSRKEDRSRLAYAEIGNRKAIRETPPAILVTNITMLEYLLLRAEDRPILEHSQGLLRWIVLDEAHGFMGAQAAEMALLLRRVGLKLTRFRGEATLSPLPVSSARFIPSCARSAGDEPQDLPLPPTSLCCAVGASSAAVGSARPVNPVPSEGGTYRGDSHETALCKPDFPKNGRPAIFPRAGPDDGQP